MRTREGLLLEVDRVSKSFPGVLALDGVSFACRRGQIHGLVGENGAGKSTLVKILAGVYAPDEGRVLWNGRPVAVFTPAHARRLGIAVIYQEFSLVPGLTVAQNIFLGQEPRRGLRIDTRAARRSARELLRTLGLDVPVDLPVDVLPLAAQQKVEIAKALSHDAELLIFDEPTAALSQEEARVLLGHLRAFRDQGKAVVFISHRLPEVLRTVDVITVLKDGRVVDTVPAREATEDALIEKMVGRRLTQTFPARSRPAAAPAPVLQVDGLCVPGAVFGVSLELARGEIVGLVGLEGHGQREILRALFGLEPRATGTVTVAGRPVAPRSPAAAVRAGLSLVTEDRKAEGLILPFRVRSNMALSNLQRWQRWHIVPLRREQQAAAAMVRDLNVRPADPGRVVRLLSGGNQQKVVLGKWLLGEPRVLLLSDPTRGIDVATRLEFYQLIRHLAARGVAVLLTSRDMTEVIGLSDRILVLYQGRVVRSLVSADASEESVMRIIVEASRAASAAQPVETA
jgi:ribose transport system ATP-binding protein